jgi:hypothetical protein
MTLFIKNEKKGWKNQICRANCLPFPLKDFPFSYEGFLIFPQASNIDY